MTKSQMKFVAESYAKYFGRAADADTIKEYGLKENGKAEEKSVILENIIADADVEKGQIDPADFVNNAFQNLFGRNATTKEMSKYYKVVDAGKDLPINSIVNSATKTDKAVYNNKMAVAVKYAELGGKGDLDLSKISKGNLIDIKFVNTVTKAADLEAKIVALADKSGIPSSFDGKTFFLTTSVDAGKDFIGTNKDDQFIADNSASVKTSAADTLDGGKGTDTFKLYAAAAAVVTTAATLPTLKNIENVVIYDNAAKVGGGATVDLKKWDSVETLFLVRDTSADAYDLGEKVTTVNVVDTTTTATNKPTLNFDNALTAATLGVNNVNATGANSVTVAGAALKTLTVDASGKASNVALVNNVIETLNITGKANLTLDATNTSITAVKTVDGSKAQGNLTFSNTANMTSIKTGSGNDTVTVAAAVASGETINLGAGNDKLVKSGAGSVATSTTTVIDGGDGIDSLDAALVTAGNASVFANFETLSLTTNSSNLDLNLVNKSTFATIALDGATTSTVRNVSTSQSLTVNATATTTTLLFKDVAGTADAYKINFDATNATGIAAGTVVVAGIETVTVDSVGKAGAANSIALTDADAKSLVVTGDSALTLTFAVGFGTNGTAGNGLGVSTIDASASTAGITLTNFSNLLIAENGLTIKGGSGVDTITATSIAASKDLTIDAGAGNDIINTTGATGKVIVNAGAGDDTLTVGAVGGTFTLGAGNDKIDVSSATAGATPATAITEAAAKKTIITDASKGDIIKGLNTALLSKIVLTTEANIDAALATATGTANTNTWFQYAGDIYIVKGDATTGFTEGDTLVKLNGLVDLGNSTISAGDLTIA